MSSGRLASEACSLTVPEKTPTNPNAFRCRHTQNVKPDSPPITSAHFLQIWLEVETCWDQGPGHKDRSTLSLLIVDSRTDSLDTL
jgi:hypothetical protein